MSVEDEWAEAVALLRGCGAADCITAPGTLRWACRCAKRRMDLLARIDARLGARIEGGLAVAYHKGHERT